MQYQSAESGLKITNVDFLLQTNSLFHHTDEFAHSCLLVRRGQEFTVKLVFNRELAPNDKVFLQFTLGQKPMQSNESFVEIEVKSAPDQKRWSATISKKVGKECLVGVRSPPDAIIGKYLLTVKTRTGFRFTPPTNSIYILFNPWCQSDNVFMPEEHERKEYVLCDTGYIYVGSANSISGRPWNFGQFEDNVLESCMYLLDKSGLKSSARKDPVIVSRAMSAMVNSNDDDGVLTGNWSGKYPGGVSPLSWTGSAAILQKYYKSRKPVKYGQCWVYSGVLTTVLRCLGIPARSVTNFASAHDTEDNLKVDIYIDEKGQKLDDWTSDSVWNFHVWNDVWMKRPDLPQGYDGWQALDATPQEPSQGIFQCGPSPLKAIKSGEVYLLYDSKFIFAEVNADKIYWMVKDVNGTEEVVQVHEERANIGLHISTKAVNQNTREDITSQYKFTEGSAEERNTMQNACSYLKTESCFAFAPPPPPSAIELEILHDETLFPGNPIALKILVTKDCEEMETINITAGCHLQTYTGKTVANLASIKQTLELGENEVTVPLDVPADVYMKSLVAVEDELQIKVNVISENVVNEQTYSVEKIIAFQYPPIQVEMPETAKINQDFTCTFTFKNSLCIPLDNCKLHVEGLGIFKMATFEQGDVCPGGIFRSKIICNPTKTGTKKIVAKINSTQVKGITAERMIDITA
ncbi:protein-glutamine gamma-glutamyltransferase 4 [Ambystoma mexicanum]|uniref:protein-glutamine gamma-glutamyltransferase 4 n=1 Tax=Ambystoma mexicanum TaxID=8296 RepID=UPI0037E7E1D2